MLGIVQGLSEFLPISSDGHLVIAQALLNAAAGPAFSTGSDLERVVALHIGTLAALMVEYLHDVPWLLRRISVCVALVIATIPAVVVGLLFEDLFDAVFTSPIWAGAGLLVTSGLLMAGQTYDSGTRPVDLVSKLQALVIGLFQAIAPLPGVSRSGSTIAGGMLVGLERTAAAKFSFLMAIPVTGGAVLLKGYKAFQRGHTETPLPVLAVGIVVSFVVGVLALKTLLALIPRRKLHWFALYCAIVGLATIAWQLLASEPTA